MADSKENHIGYTTMTGFFQQDDPATDDVTFDYTTSNFGLIDRPYDTDADFDPERRKTQWERFDHLVHELNQTSAANVQYKVLYMGRHGEGHHNVAESFYGKKAWDDYWSKLDGNDIITWANAKLTRAGEAQAVKANQFWRSAIAEQNIPVPEQYYCSPLARCLETARISFASLRLPPDRSFVPLVKELFRENIGEHPCDRHSTKSWIQENYPGYILERGIREEDPLWTREMESYGQFVNRTKIVLDDVILHDKSTYISISAHTGLSRAALEVLGHRPFSLGTGQAIAILVKTETLEGPDPRPAKDLYVTIPAYLASLQD